MTLDLIIFLVLATIAVVAALAMLLSDNAIYSALFLILNFAVVSVFYLMLNAPFIAMVQVTGLCRGDHGVVPVRDHAARRG